MEIGGPEAGGETLHDGMFGRHDVVDLARAVTVVPTVRGAEVAGGEGLVLFGELGVFGELEEMGGGADGDEGFVSQVLVEGAVLGGLEVGKADGKNEEIGFG